MTSQSPDDPFASLFDDPELEAVFARASPADTIAAVLTEARIVLADVDSPLDAELWGSDIVAALGSGAGQADAIVPAAEQSGTPEALATLRVLGAVGAPQLREPRPRRPTGSRRQGIAEPAWAGSIGAPVPGDGWRYGDAFGQQEAVTDQLLVRRPGACGVGSARPRSGWRHQECLGGGRGRRPRPDQGTVAAGP